jgi:hypothetical protein
LTELTVARGVAATVALLGAVSLIAVAFGLHASLHRRKLGYAAAAPDLLRIVEKARLADPYTLTPGQVVELCRSVLNDTADAFAKLTGARPFVSVELMASTVPTLPAAQASELRAIDFVIETLCRDETSERLAGGLKLRMAVEANSSFRHIFRDPECSTFYHAGDVAKVRNFRCSLLDALEERSSAAPARDSLHYRATLVVKICQRDRCTSRQAHFPAGYLCLHSPLPHAFDAAIDVEIVQSIARAMAPLVSRLAGATLPVRDFRRGVDGATGGQQARRTAL